MAGLEPARPCGRGILSPLRLPFRHIPDDFTTLHSKYLRHVSSCRLAAITVADNERGRNERKPFRAQKRPWQSQRSTLRTGLRWTQVARSRVRALWKRGEVFYARFSATDHARRARDTFRSLEGVTTVQRQLFFPTGKNNRRCSDDGPCRQGRTSKPQNRSQQAEHPHRWTLPFVRRNRGPVPVGGLREQAPPTFRKERAHIAWWTARLGTLPLHRIHRTHVNARIAYGFGVP